jgi:hypothetical protein
MTEQADSDPRRLLRLIESGTVVVTGGFKLAAAGLLEQRLASCRTCSSYEEDRHVCTSCGCKLALKAIFEDLKCPEGRW